MNLILVRHGETDWNSQQRYQGQLDIPLNNKGTWQAQQAASALAGEPIDLLVSSDLLRARATAEAIATACAVPLRTDARLREISFGSWEGLSTDQIKEQDGEAYRRWRENPTAHAPVGGETLAATGRRVLSFWQEISEMNRESLVVVSHGGTLRILISHLLQLPPESFWQMKLGNTGITRLAITGSQVRLDLLNDMGHLQKVSEA